MRCHFSSCVWKSCRLVLVFFVTLFFLMNAFWSFRILDHSEHCYQLYKKTLDKSSNMNYTGWRGQSGVLYPPVFWKLHIVLVMKQSENSTIFKCWTFTSCHKLSNFTRSLHFSAMEFLFRLYGSPFLIWMKCSWNHELKDTVQQVGEQNHLTSP